MSQVLNFFKGKTTQPVITTQQVERVQDVLESAKMSDINFLKFLIDILKFNKFVKNNINELSLDKQPLGEWLNNKNFSKQFQENYILPMSAAIWSMNFNDVLNYPISNLFSFFNNHRLLHEKKLRPQWLTVSNGSCLLYTSDAADE